MKKTTILVSRCLLGVPCRYHGRAVAHHSRIKSLEQTGKYQIIDICPEVDAGLSVPRPPTRVRNGALVCGGRDVSGDFERGAQMAVARARECGACKAYLVKGSPSCDRTKGVAAMALQSAGVKVVAI